MSEPIASVVSPCSFARQLTEEEQQYRNAKLILLYKRYKNKFTTFPKEKGWWCEHLYMYQGYWCQSKILSSIETTMAAQDTFKAHPNDIYLASLPKSGTTWLKALVFATMNRNWYKGKSLSTHPLQNTNPHNCVPSIEMEVLRATPSYDNIHFPRVFSTHMPYTLLPQSIIDLGCRIVYVYRNPKDVLVSLFHFSNKFRVKFGTVMTIEEAFRMFSEGMIPYGPYWDHVREYYKVGQEHPRKIIFLSYENMKKNTIDSVKHLAEFLGCPFTEEEIVNGVVDEIVSLCSFENLSEVNSEGNFRVGVPNNIFFRKGTVGDWKNYLTTEMSEIFDQIAREKFHDLDISF